MRERDLIARIRSHNPALVGVPGLDVPIPPGDDMALVRFGDGHVLVAADQVIEGRHFVRGTPMDLVARKAVARNVSDVAAMAAVPRATVATAALPRGMADQDVEALSDGLRRWAAHWGCPMVGGDVGVHAGDGPLVVSVSILAQPGPTGRVITRAGAAAGDLLCVTGALGGSLAPDGRGRHLTFEPRVGPALALASELGDRLHAMIDVSDGLLADLGHILARSNVAATVHVDRLPDVPACSDTTLARDCQLSGGDDYELLFTAAAGRHGQIEALSSTLGLALTSIGNIGPGKGLTLQDADGRPLSIARRGFDHFAP